jgi:uncharacterized Zn-finger protein
VCSELIIGTEDFIGGISVSAEHGGSRQRHGSGISSQSKHPGKNGAVILRVKQFVSKVRKRGCSESQRKTYQCDLCTKSFTRQGHLTEHRRTHTGEKPYRCEICSKSFTQRGNLELHLRTHPADKPFKCDFCIKRFTQRAHLVEHRRIHTGEKPFVCDFCNRGFSQQGHLVAHTRTHTGDKPFSCYACNKRFSSSGYLLVHTRSHAGEKPHKCDSCDKSFIQHRDLVRHSRTHTVAKPYKCEICQKRFPDQGNFARHRRTHAESIHKYVSWKVSNNMEGTLSPALEGHLIDMQWNEIIYKVQCLLPPYSTQFTFTLFISVSQHVLAYAKAIFRCGFISNNIILKKTTAIQRIRSFYCIIVCVLFVFQCSEICHKVESELSCVRW